MTLDDFMAVLEEAGSGSPRAAALIGAALLEAETLAIAHLRPGQKERVMSSNRRHQTQWAAQFAVASELCKRGYEVAFTLGNTTPLADLMVVSPERHQMFLIDVKGLAGKNYWQITRKESRSDLFYILALVERDRPNQFFVMTQETVNAGIAAEFSRLKPEKQGPWRKGKQAWPPMGRCQTVR